MSCSLSFSRSSAARRPPLCSPSLTPRHSRPRAGALTAAARPNRRYHSGCYNDNSTLCFGCVESHAASLAKANCSSFEEQEFCSSHHYHEVECESNTSMQPIARSLMRFSSEPAVP